MKGVLGFRNAIVVALISVGLIIGALSISLVEFVPEAAPTATTNLLPSPAPLTATSTLTPSLVPTNAPESPIPSITATFTNTATPPTSCQPPFGWINQITVQVGDTLDSIAIRNRVSKDDLRSANCLLSDTLITSSKLYVPPTPTSTIITSTIASTIARCIPGAAGWVHSYIVQPGDTLFRIGYSHYTTLDLMRKANCRVSDTIYAGENLWVPNIATRTPSPTSFIPSNTPVTPTSTATPTDIPTSTATPTDIPTSIPTPTDIPVSPVP